MDAAKRHTAVIYTKIAYVLLLIFPWATIIFDYVVRRAYAEDAVLRSHITYQIKTFWTTLLGAILGCVCYVVLAVIAIGPLIGTLLICGVGIWSVYRAIKGYSTLHKNAAI